MRRRAHPALLGNAADGAKADCRAAPPRRRSSQGDLAGGGAGGGLRAELNLPDEGNTHIQVDDPEPTYKTNPPTSGNHITAPLQAADGAYRTPIGPDHTVHAMEHGRVEIQYSPDLPEDHQLALKGVFDEDPDGMLLFPNDDMPYEVAVNRLDPAHGLPQVHAQTLDAIRDFRDTYRGQGPEQQVPISL